MDRVCEWSKGIPIQCITNLPAKIQESDNTALRFDETTNLSVHLVIEPRCAISSFFARGANCLFACLLVCLFMADAVLFLGSMGGVGR